MMDVTTNCEYVFNRLYMIDADLHHTTFSLWCPCPRDLGSAPAGGTGWAFSPLYMNGLTKQSFASLFWQWSCFLSL